MSTMDEVEFREMEAGTGMGPRSVSQYDDTFHSLSAYEALKDASTQLLPLADYIENHFVISEPATKPREHHAEGYILISFTASYLKCDLNYI